jgi:hypothetical protein
MKRFRLTLLAGCSLPLWIAAVHLTEPRAASSPSPGRRLYRYTFVDAGVDHPVSIVVPYPKPVRSATFEGSPCRRVT